MEQLAVLFKGLADTSRLRILNLLSRHSICVCDLQTILGAPQPFISRHLAYLRRVKLVRSKREGTRVCYSLTFSNHFSYPVQLLLREVLPHSPVFQMDLQNLAECQSAGTLRSQVFQHQTLQPNEVREVVAAMKHYGPQPAPAFNATESTETSNGGQQ